MSFPFHPQQGLIEVSAKVTGPSGAAALRLALDTGAENTVLDTAALVALGYNPALAPQHIQIVTASGTESVPQIPVLTFEALGQVRRNIPVLCHTFPAGVGLDGLLGLDFFRGHVLTLDFQNGQITLA